MLKSECILRSMCAWLYVFYSPKSGAVNGLFIAYDTKCHFKSRCHAEKGDACKSELEEQGRVADTRPMGLAHRRPGPPCRAGTGQAGITAPGSLKPQGFAPVNTARTAVPGVRAALWLTACHPGCAGRRFLPFRAVPENSNPKQTAKLSKHTF